MTSQNLIIFFENLKKNDDLHLNMPQIGCFARTDIICAELEKQGYSAKTIRTNVDGQGMKGRVFYKEDGADKVSIKDVNWNFHIAAGVEVDGQTIVLDPSILSGPEKIEKWLQNMNVKGRTLSLEDCLVEDYQTSGKSFINKVYKDTNAKDSSDFFQNIKSPKPFKTPITKPSSWLTEQLQKSKATLQRA